MKKLLLLLLLTVFGLSAQETSRTFTIYFGHDQYELTPAAKATLDSVAPYAKLLSDVSISSFGYTDDSGTMVYNKMLAADRANAAKDYLEGQGLTVGSIGSSRYGENKPTTPEQQRRAQVTVKGNPSGAVGMDGYGPQEFTAPGGTTVTAKVKNGSEGAVEVEEFFTPESMIANGMYGIDVNGKLLQTDGMIEICNDGKTLDPDGKTYTVKMPANRGKINRSMSIWLAIKEADGGIRWKNTQIDITTDPEEKYYIFKVPAETHGCVRVNLDRSVCGTSDNKDGRPVGVYVEMFKPYDFYTVSISGNSGLANQNVTFSAKLGKQLWAFAGPDNDQVRNLAFVGKYWEDGVEKTYTASLSTARYKYNKKDRSHHFYIRPTKQKKGVTPKRETGFWAWVKRQFS